MTCEEFDQERRLDGAGGGKVQRGIGRIQGVPRGTADPEAGSDRFTMVGEDFSDVPIERPAIEPGRQDAGDPRVDPRTTTTANAATDFRNIMATSPSYLLLMR